MRVRFEKNYIQYDDAIKEIGIRKFAKMVGMDKGEISRIVNGKRAVSINQMYRFDEALDKFNKLSLQRESGKK